MTNSYIKIYRSLESWDWYKDSNMVHLFIHLLIKANFVKGSFQGKEVKRGQLITGLNSLHESTGISMQSIRTCLKKLKLTNEITIEATNKYSLITIVKYDFYQSFDEKPTRKSTRSLTFEQQSTNNQLTTIKEEEERNNIYIPTLSEFLDYAKSECEKVGKDFDKYSYSIKAKYEAWVEAKWKDGNGEKIKNWKTKFKNTLPYLKEFYQKEEVRYAGNGIGGVL